MTHEPENDELMAAVRHAAGGLEAVLQAMDELGPERWLEAMESGAWKKWASLTAVIDRLDATIEATIADLRANGNHEVADRWQAILEHR